MQGRRVVAGSPGPAVARPAPFPEVPAYLGAVPPDGGHYPGFCFGEASEAERAPRPYLRCWALGFRVPPGGTVVQLRRGGNRPLWRGPALGCGLLLCAAAGPWAPSGSPKPSCTLAPEEVYVLPPRLSPSTSVTGSTSTTTSLIIRNSLRLRCRAPEGQREEGAVDVVVENG